MKNKNKEKLFALKEIIKWSPEIIPALFLSLVEKGAVKTFKELKRVYQK